MSLVNLYKGQVKSAQTKVKTLRDTRDRKRSSLTAPKRRLGQLQTSLRQARSDSQRQSVERQIESKEKEVTRGEEGVGRAEDDLSKAEKTLDTARDKLGKAEEAEIRRPRNEALNRRSNAKNNRNDNKLSVAIVKIGNAPIGRHHRTRRSRTFGFEPLTSRAACWRLNAKRLPPSSRSCFLLPAHRTRHHYD
jgi:chromosome segregation ATPase